MTIKTVVNNTELRSINIFCKTWSENIFAEKPNNSLPHPNTTPTRLSSGCCLNKYYTYPTMGTMLHSTCQLYMINQDKYLLLFITNLRTSMGAQVPACKRSFVGPKIPQVHAVFVISNACSMHLTNKAIWPASGE